ncbi:hypothetical protein SAMN02745136_02696 [Anaerocolumna jejuensis DSM 15929]|uniref:Uncharacterized protein n=1 Tax=Anaerocolumna jejuensis DSM 15929 TaxID=1121322 RepID=A0A1M6T952_9FIRM|nr:hypothetical protein SAMN02745136_02696 [Anaerocolumna jejuensis DSM 15929]
MSSISILKQVDMEFFCGFKIQFKYYHFTLSGFCDIRILNTNSMNIKSTEGMIWELEKSKKSREKKRF